MTQTFMGLVEHHSPLYEAGRKPRVMQRNAADIVGGFLTELLGEEMEPWQESGNVEMAVST